MQELLVSELGFLGDSAAYKAILEEDYEPPNSIDYYSKAYIKVLAKPQTIVNLPKAILIAKGCRVEWRKMKEVTSVGISGIHFKYMKFYAHSLALSNFEVIIRHISYVTDYPPPP